MKALRLLLTFFDAAIYFTCLFFMVRYAFEQNAPMFYGLLPQQVFGQFL